MTKRLRELRGDLDAVLGAPGAHLRQAAGHVEGWAG